MVSEQIVALASSGESETLEFKETTGTRREAARTVCAFLNQDGGQVLFGVNRDGDVVGQQVGGRTIEELSAELQQIDPPAFPTVERVPVDGGREVIVVSTGRGPTRPYIFRGSAYRRVGNTTLAMSPDEYNRMLFERMHSEQRWENQPAIGWSISDLDVAEIRRVVAEGVRRGRMDEPPSREPTDLLRGLGVVRDGVLLRAATVLFGNRERLEVDMPQCLLRVARFREPTKRSFWTIANSTAIPLHSSRTRNVFCATACRSPLDSRMIASTESTNRFTHHWRRARDSRTRCAIATTPLEAVPLAWRSTMTAWRLRPPDRCTSA